MDDMTCCASVVQRALGVIVHSRFAKDLVADSGKAGWNFDDLIARFGDHPQKGNRFFDLGFVSDSNIAKLYRRAKATLVASIVEGFGLPIYEAAYFGSPLLLSDLPVFKELVGAQALYFQPGSATSVAAAVRRILSSHSLSSSSIKVPTWNEFAAQVFEFISGKNTHFVFE